MDAAAIISQRGIFQEYKVYIEHPHDYLHSLYDRNLYILSSKFIRVRDTEGGEY